MDDADGNYFMATSQVVWWHMQSHTQMKGTLMESFLEHTGGKSGFKVTQVIGNWVSGGNLVHTNHVHQQTHL